MIDAVSVHVRKLYTTDRQAVRKISCSTAFLDEDSNKIFGNDEMLADILTLYFTDYEPQSCFVAIREGKVIGYLIGAKDVKVMRKVFNHKIIPQLIIRAVKERILSKINTRLFLLRAALGFLKGEFLAPDFSGKYPATLHVNIDRGWRGQGAGRMLVERYIHFLGENNVKGVHFGTRSEYAMEFFVRLGFAILRKSKRSYLRHYLNKKMPYYILGKKI